MADISTYTQEVLDCLVRLGNAVTSIEFGMPTGFFTRDVKGVNEIDTSRYPLTDGVAYMECSLFVQFYAQRHKEYLFIALCHPKAPMYASPNIHLLIHQPLNDLRHQIIEECPESNYKEFENVSQWLYKLGEDQYLGFCPEGAMVRSFQEWSNYLDGLLGDLLDFPFEPLSTPPDVDMPKEVKLVFQNGNWIVITQQS